MKNLLTSEKRLWLIIGIVFGVLFVLVVIGYLAFRYYAPFGKAVSYQFNKKLPGSEVVTTLSGGKSGYINIPSQILTTSFSRFPIELISRDIESIQTTLKFKKGPEEIKLGVKGRENDSYTYQPLYNSLFDNLNWSKLESNEFILWQRQKDFLTLYDFVNNPSYNKKTAVYYINPDKLLSIKSNQPTSNNQTIIETILRGSCSLLTRVTENTLKLTVVKQDLNSYEGADKLNILVRKGENIIAEKTIADDGVVARNLLKMQPQSENIVLEDLSPGLYQIDLVSDSSGNDVLIKRIEINQPQVIFKNQIYVLSEVPTTFWTDAKQITVLTWHQQGIQSLTLNDKENLVVGELGKEYQFDLESLSGNEKSQLYKLNTQKNDLIIKGNGYFSFNESSYFSLGIANSINLVDLDNLDSVDYILTSYQPARREGEWYIAETIIDASDIQIDGNKLYFSLEVPNIDKYGGELEIESLEIEVKSKGALSDLADKHESESESGEKVGFLASAKDKIAGIFKKDKDTSQESQTDKKENIFKRAYVSFKKFIDDKLLKYVLKKDSDKEGSDKKDDDVIVIESKNTPVPSPTPTPAKYDISVKIQNGGAEEGAAGEIADELKKLGFTKVSAENADNKDYVDAQISFSSKNKNEAEKIIEVLKREYKKVSEKTGDDKEIVVILGKKQ